MKSPATVVFPRTIALFSLGFLAMISAHGIVPNAGPCAADDFTTKYESEKCECYNICQGGVLKETKCDTGNYFEVDLKVCAPMDAVDCMGRKVPVTNSNITCPHENGSFNMPNNCDDAKYMECYDWKAYEGTCDEGLAFDWWKCRCGPKEAINGPSDYYGRC